MGLFEGCLLASDIDGTLFSNGSLPQINLEKIKYFVDEGGVFSLATGRIPITSAKVFEAIGGVGPSVFANGGLIYDLSTDTVLHSVNVPPKGRQMVKEVLETLPEVGIEAHTDGEILVIRETEETKDHKKYLNIEAKCIDYENALLYNWNKALYLTEDEEKRQALHRIAQKYESSCHFAESSVVYKGKKRTYLEQVARGVTKGTGLETLRDIFGIKEGCLFAIGDYYNDVPMLAIADVAAAPKGAPDDIKNTVDVVVESAENGAVADFIDYLTKRKEAENGRTEKT